MIKCYACVAKHFQTYKIITSSEKVWMPWLDVYLMSVCRSGTIGKTPGTTTLRSRPSSTRGTSLQSTRVTSATNTTSKQAPSFHQRCRNQLLQCTSYIQKTQFLYCILQVYVIFKNTKLYFYSFYSDSSEEDYV